MRKKILHIITELPPEGNDTVEFTANLAKAQRMADNDVVIAAIAGDNLAVSAFEAEEVGVRIGRFAPSNTPTRYHFSREMFRNLRKVVKGADTIHIHGTGTFPVWWGAFLAMLEKKRLIFSPHGGCSASARCTGNKFASIIDRFFIRHSTIVHAISESEKTAITSAIRGIDGKTLVVAPGIELPHLMPKAQSHDTRTFLYIGRISENNGLDMLLDAFAKCDAKKAYKLIVCGPADEGAVNEFEHIAEKLGIRDKIEFREPVTAMAKWRVYRESDCFVLPTRNEDFGTSIVEALACGVPVICTKGAPWEILATEHCGWWCDISADGLAIAIRDMLYHYDEELVEMGNNGKKLVAARFNWSKAAELLSN